MLMQLKQNTRSFFRARLRKMSTASAVADFKEDRTLWMGDLTAYMDSNFIGEALHKMGIEVSTIKVIYDKYNGKPAGYCFVELPDTETARRCMLTVNGKIIPDSKPPIQFKLSFATGHSNPNADYSILVSNLPHEVDDALLYNIFGNRYPSCRGARVFRNPDGSSKGTGSLRFADETEQQTALVEMNRFAVFGKSISLRLAPPRTRFPPGAKSGSRKYDPSNYYSQYQDYYSSGAPQWPTPYGPRGPPSGGGPRGMIPPPGIRPPIDQRRVQNRDQNFDRKLPPDVAIPEELMPEDNSNEISIEQENRKFVEQSEDLYTAMEDSNWFGVTSASLRMEAI